MQPITLTSRKGIVHTEQAPSLATASRTRTKPALSPGQRMERIFAIHSVYLPRILDAVDEFSGTVLNDIRSFSGLDQFGHGWDARAALAEEWIAYPTSRIDLDAAYARGAC